MLMVTMSSAPPPTTPPNGGSALQVLRNRIQQLHLHTGELSTREIARRAGKGISHTTAHAVLRCLKRPQWGQLELVVEALGGDVEEFRALWITSRSAPAASPPVPVELYRAEGDPLGHTGTVYAVAFHPDGHQLATADANRTVRLWDPATQQQVGDPLTGHTGAVRAVAFHPDGHQLATASDDGTVRRWNGSL